MLLGKKLGIDGKLNSKSSATTELGLFVEDRNKL